MNMKVLMAALMALTFVCSVGPTVAADAPTAPAAAAPAEKPPIPKVGDAFKDFTIKDADGKSVNFNSDIKGKSKYTALIFMNTACSACMAEARIVNAVASENKDLAVYAILVDARGEAAVAAYKERNPLPNVKFLLDKDFSIPPVYGYTYTPAMVLVDKGGVILESKGGFLASQGEEFAKKLKGMLK